jgi:hypothetical protein
MKKSALLLTFVFTLSTALAPAGTIKVPQDEPAVSFNIPDNWEPEADEAGVLAESPDNVATMYFEVVGSEKELEDAVDGSVEWLDEHEVTVDEATQEEKEFKTGDREWKVISWTAKHKEWGEASVGFLFTPVGGGKVLTVTYWISKKDSDKSMATVDKILNSVKSIE